MDTLRGIPESIEAEFGDAIEARDEAILALDAAPGLGPPDLCWLQKCPKTTGWGGGQLLQDEASGYYHYVLGRDVSSIAAVAGYFAALTARVEQPGLLQGLWASREWAITRGFYCCYDPISRTDLRCELCIPGGVVVGAVDAGGGLHDATPDSWRRAQVAGFIRAQLYDPETRLGSSCCVVADDVPASTAAEAQLLGHIEWLYTSGQLPGGLAAVSAVQGYGVTPEHMDLALLAVLHHFQRRQRWQQALAFFTRLTASHPPAAVYAAAALHELGRSEEASEVVARQLERDPLNPQLLAALGAECLATQQVEAAASLARRALKQCPVARPAWILLARCSAACGAHGAALVALNVMPTPPLPRAEPEQLLLVPPPKPAAVTQPQVGAYDADAEAAKQLAVDDASTGSSRVLAHLPGAVLVNREPPGESPWSDVSPCRVTRAVLAAVYGVLQDVVAAVGWDAFLDIRGSMFLMHAEQREQPEGEGDAGKSSNGDGQQQEQQAQQAQQAQQQEQQQQQHLLEQQHQQLQQLAADLEAASLRAGQQPPQPPQQQQASPTAGSRPAPDGPGFSGPPPGFGLLAASGPIPGSPPGSSRSRRHSRGSSKGTPATYYANRLHGQQARPSGDRSGQHSPQHAPPPPPQPPPPQPPPPQPQPPAQAPPPLPLPAQAPPQQQEAGAASTPRRHEPMAGRVLLLGSKGPRLHQSASSSSTGSGRREAATGGSGAAPAAPPVRRGTSASTAAGERMGTRGSASLVAPLPMPEAMRRGSVAPQLWQTVFGGMQGYSGAVAPPATPASASGPPSLPRIRTHPVSEGAGDGAAAAAAAALRAAVSEANTAWAATSAAAAAVQGEVRAAALADNLLSVLLAAEGVGASGGAWGGDGDGSDKAGCSADGGGGGGAEGAWRLCGGASFAVAEGREMLRSGSLLVRGMSASPGPPSQAAPAPPTPGAPAGSGGAPGAQHQSGRSASLALLSLEADRAALITGAPLGSDAPGGGGGASPSRLCVRWLDELIIALWHDLQAFMEWKVLDQALRNTIGGTHAELVLGLVTMPSDGMSPTSGAGEPSVQPPHLTSTDWGRRGSLAERLRHTRDARAAYRAAVKLGMDLGAYMALMRLEADAGSTSDAVVSAQQVLLWHEGRAAAAPAGGGGGGALTAVPSAVAAALAALVSRVGLADVRRAVDDVCLPRGGGAVPGCHQLMVQVLDDLARWKAAGT